MTIQRSIVVMALALGGVIAAKGADAQVPRRLRAPAEIRQRDQ